MQAQAPGRVRADLPLMLALIAAATIALFGAIEEGQPALLFPDGVRGAVFWRIACLGTATLTVIVSVVRYRASPTWAAASLWAIAAVVSLAESAPLALTSVVAPVECLFIAALLLTKHGQSVAQGLLVGVAAALLLIFGTVHLSNVPAIAALVPSWIPGGQIWPYLTGSTQLIAGLCLCLKPARTVAAAAIAVMFASWLMLVHIPRLLNQPTDSFEWQFALMAFSLALGFFYLAQRSRESASGMDSTN